MLAALLVCSCTENNPPKSIVYHSAADNTNQIRIYNMSSGTDEMQVTVNSVKSYPDVSADGFLVYTELFDFYNYELVVYNLNTKEKKRITDDDGTNAQKMAVWNPSDHSLVFISSPSGSSEILTKSDSGGQNVLLLSEEGSNFLKIEKDPAVSADGKSIAYVSNINGLNDIYILNTENSESELITSTTCSAESPSWSPDGSKLVYVCRHTEGSVSETDLHIFSVSDRTDERIRSEGTELYPDWAPDGTEILFTSQDENGNSNPALYYPDTGAIHKIDSVTGSDSGRLP